MRFVRPLVSYRTRLRELREKRGLTITQIGELLRVPLDTLNQYEDGTLQPKVDVLIMLARYFGCTLDEFVEVLGVTPEIEAGCGAPDGPYRAIDLWIRNREEQQRQAEKEKRHGARNLSGDDGVQLATAGEAGGGSVLG